MPARRVWRHQTRLGTRGSSHPFEVDQSISRCADSFTCTADIAAMRIGTPLGSARLARQRITRTRREYNRWVANQTLEDYALRFTAKTAR